MNRSGIYYYKILAIPNQGEKILLREQSFHLQNNYINPNVISLDLDVKKKTIVNIDIYSYPIKHFLGNYKAAYDDHFQLDLKPYLVNDVKQVTLLITNLTGTLQKEMIVDIK